MNIAIDAAPLYHGIAGISIYTKGLIQGLATIDSGNNYFIYGGRQGFFPSKEWEKILLDSEEMARHPNFHLVVSRAPKRFSAILNLLPVEFYIGVKDIDIYHATSFLLPRKTRKTTKKIVTIHDLSFEVNIGWYPQKIYSQKWRDAVRKSAEIADKIIAPSQSTKKDITSIYGISPDRVEVIPEAALDIFSEPYDKRRAEYVKNLYHLPDNYILAVGRIEKRKNFTAILDALKLLKNNLNAAVPKLVIAGNDGYGSSEFYKHLAKSGLSDDVLIYKYLPMEDLPVFYREARMFVFPSLYEGFGLPILEAFASGCPVICSERTSMKEVAVGEEEGGEEKSAILVNPDSPTQIADAIMRLLADENLRDFYIKKGKERSRKFTWESAARSTLEIYKSVLSR